MEMLNQKQKIMLIIIIAVVVVVIGYYYINSTKTVYSSIQTENMIEGAEEISKTIIVHITGAVNKSGIVEVKEKARISDVIETAGGITEDADLTNVNLAYIVEDGQKIYIPSIDDKEDTNTIKEEQNIISSTPGENIIEGIYADETLIININKASTEELTSLPGIGEATAAKIIEYRKTNGNFQNIEEIKNVSGIGEAKFDTIKEFISV